MEELVDTGVPELSLSSSTTNLVAGEAAPPSTTSPCATEPGTAACAIILTGDTNDSCQRRSRHHHSHRRSASRRRRRACRIKWKDVNFVAAMCAVVVAVLVCMSLAEPHWWYISGGQCHNAKGQPVNYLGVRMFFYHGYFESGSWFEDTQQQRNTYHYGNSADDVLIDCVTPHAIFTMQGIISLCFVVLLLAVTGFILDLLTCMDKCTKFLRNNAIIYIITVCLCVTINGLSYLVTQQLTAYYDKTRLTETSKVDVEFSLSFYMIMAAGAVSVMAVACSLLCRRIGRPASRWSASLIDQIGRRQRDEQLLSGADDYEQRSNHPLGSCAVIGAPPPPYTP